jgi:hypothetical protein
MCWGPLTGFKLWVLESRNLMLTYGLKAMLVGNLVTERQVIHMYPSIMYNVSSSYPCYEWTCKKMSLTYFKRRIKPGNRLKRSIGCFIPMYKYELVWMTNQTLCPSSSLKRWRNYHGTSTISGEIERWCQTHVPIHYEDIKWNLDNIWSLHQID